MREDAELAAWQTVTETPVIGRIGHRLVYPAGPAHPTAPAPAWVTPRGVDLARLHATYLTYRLVERRGDRVECSTGEVVCAI